MNKRKIGNSYEEKSCEILLENKYEILERNYQNRYGEIDIVAIKDMEIVFIEVKYRKNKKYGYGYEAIDRKKIKKIFNLAQAYVQDQEKKYFNYSLRFDCMSYLGDELEWIIDIARGDELEF